MRSCCMYTSQDTSEPVRYSLMMLNKVTGRNKREHDRMTRNFNCLLITRTEILDSGHVVVPDRDLNTPFTVSAPFALVARADYYTLA